MESNVYLTCKMENSLTKKAVSGVFWTFLERVGTQLASFVVSIVLARLLTPNDYGTVGLLYVFVTISQLLISCGYSNALIRKKDCSEADYATVFWTNLSLSGLFYLILFLCAPLVSRFYHMPILTGLLRVMGLSLMLNALYTVHVTRLTVTLNFKMQAKIAVFPTLLSGIVGMIMAYCGLGPWALVGQNVSSGIFCIIIYNVIVGWRPKFQFSIQSFKEIFGYGIKLMAASIIDKIYNNVGPLIVARKFSTADLGFYSRADGLVNMPAGLFNSIVGKVFFPVLAKVQDDEKRLCSACIRYLYINTAVIVLGMSLLAAVAKPLIIILIGEKWLASVPYIRILCTGFIVEAFSVVCITMLYVKGRSDIVLKMEIPKKAIGIAIIAIMVQFGVIWLCVGQVLFWFEAAIFHMWGIKKFLNVGYWRQFMLVLPIYTVGLAAGFCGYVMASWLANVYLSFVFGSMVTLAVFILGAWLLKFDILLEGVKVFNGMIRRRS